MTIAVTERLEPRILARPEHTLSRRQISTEALKVLYRLHRSGYLAYLVGGGVRDLLLDMRPKDFDIGTNARPQEVRRLFGNSRIIGRRFRLVHVMFKDEVVEVATFRASPEPPEGPDEWEEAEQEAIEEAAAGVAQPAPPEAGVYGSPAEDARRRDFTVNALFYNIADFTIIDHVGGIEDLEARLLRTIGDAEARFLEDPVRMMRALEYRVRLGFEVEDQALAAIGRCRDRISEASPARLTYELLEGMRSGCGAGIWGEWRRTGISERAFPDLCCASPHTERALEALDLATAGGGSPSDATVIGAFYLARFDELSRRATSDGGRVDNSALLLQLRDLLAPAAARMHLANHTVHLIHHGLFALTKMQRAPERARQVLKLVRQDYFQVAWDLYGLAAETGLVSAETHGAWSRAVARVRRGQIEEAVVEGREDRARSRRRRRPRRRRRR